MGIIDKMKIVIKALIALVLATAIMSGKLRGKPGPTPKAADLGDHFGTEPIKNIYKEIEPTRVVNGDLDNTSYDASKIIRPAIAAPKFDIKNQIVHEAVVKTPVHMGMTVEEKTVETMNRQTGVVTKKTITTEKPIVGVVNNAREVKTNTQMYVNANTGKPISTYSKPEYHGNGVI